MHDKLLYKEIKNVPISIIQEKVCEATNIPILLMLKNNKYPGARKKEIVGPRQISMTLSMRFGKYVSLAVVGNYHGGRDHATVLHAIKTVNNLIDTHDYTMLTNYKKSMDLIKEWNSNRTDIPKRLTFKELIKSKKELNNELFHINEQLNSILISKIDNKTKLIKIWIKNNVPLEIRQKLLLNQIPIKYEND